MIWAVIRKKYKSYKFLLINIDCKGGRSRKVYDIAATKRYHEKYKSTSVFKEV
jgi:hypothetical protein